jgi:hypothetical protein
MRDMKKDILKVKTTKKKKKIKKSFKVIKFFYMNATPSYIKKNIYKKQNAYVDIGIHNKDLYREPIMRNIDRLADMPQICLEVSRKNDALVLAASACQGHRLHAQDAYYADLLNYTGGTQTIPYSLHFMCPHPVIVSNAFVRELKVFHEALSRALAQTSCNDGLPARRLRIPRGCLSNDMKKSCSRYGLAHHVHESMSHGWFADPA